MKRSALAAVFAAVVTLAAILAAGCLHRTPHEADRPIITVDRDGD